MCRLDAQLFPVLQRHSSNRPMMILYASHTFRIPFAEIFS
jgi:hypothetical protein